MENKILHSIFLPPVILGITYLLYVFVKISEKGGDGGWELTLLFHGIIFGIYLLIYFLCWAIVKIINKIN